MNAGFAMYRLCRNRTWSRFATPGSGKAYRWGGGGGQKTMATAGGQDASRLTEVGAVVKALL